MRDIPLFDRFSMRILALWGACAAAIIGAIVWCCQGRFILALDDPYIHLSVAHNLIGGHYGINADEASSPSSSILWPWLLTLTEALHLGALGPLALSFVGATDKESIAAIKKLEAKHGDGWVHEWLAGRGVKLEDYGVGT